MLKADWLKFEQVSLIVSYNNEVNLKWIPKKGNAPLLHQIQVLVCTGVPLKQAKISEWIIRNNQIDQLFDH